MTDANEKNKRKKRVGIFIIANAIVWGAVIIGIALTVRGTGLMNKLIPILGAGSAFSVVILSSLLIEKKK